LVRLDAWVVLDSRRRDRALPLHPGSPRALGRALGAAASRRTSRGAPGRPPLRRLPGGASVERPARSAALCIGPAPAALGARRVPPGGLDDLAAAGGGRHSRNVPGRGCP